MRPAREALNVAVTSTGGRQPALVAVRKGAPASDVTSDQGRTGRHHCGCGAVPAREKP